MISAARVLTLTAAVMTLGGVIQGLSLARSGEASPVRRRYIVEIRQLQFQPAEITVAPGDTVTWINRDIVPHTATAPDAAWDSEELTNGASWQWIASANATTTYFCAYHPTMRGRIIVQ